MSKSYSKAERRGKCRERRCRERDESSSEWVEYVRTSEQPEKVTPEWAVERMTPQIDFAVKCLVDADLIGESDRDDYWQAIASKVSQAAERYDPGRKGANGRTSSAVHFLSEVVKNMTANIVIARNTYDAPGTEIPFGAMQPKDNDGYRLEGDFDLSDECKSINGLIFRMDMEVIRGYFSPAHRKVFDMLMAGYPHREIQEAIGVFGGSFYRKYVEHLRYVLRKCGYAPEGQNEDL